MGARTTIVVVVAVIIFGALLWYGSTLHPSNNLGQTQGGQAAATSTYAPKGELIPNFPRNLILNSNSGINESYVINYASSTHQYTAQWDSSSSIDAVASQYEAFFKSSGWSVTPNPATVSWLRGVSAATSSAYVLVNIATKGSGSEITLSYVVK